MTTYYPGKFPTLILIVGRIIWPTQHPNDKPSNLKSFHPYDLLNYVTYVDPIKYPTLFPSIVSLIS